MQIIIIITTTLPSRDDIKVNLVSHGDTFNIVRSNADGGDDDGPPQYIPGRQGRRFIYLFDGNGSHPPYDLPPDIATSFDNTDIIA